MSLSLNAARRPEEWKDRVALAATGERGIERVRVRVSKDIFFCDWENRRWLSGLVRVGFRGVWGWLWRETSVKDDAIMEV